jgi:hypothetical protein
MNPSFIGEGRSQDGLIGDSVKPISPYVRLRGLNGQSGRTGVHATSGCSSARAGKARAVFDWWLHVKDGLEWNVPAGGSRGENGLPRSV